MFSSQLPPLCRTFPVLQCQNQATARVSDCCCTFSPLWPPAQTNQGGPPHPRWVNSRKDTLETVKCFTAVGGLSLSHLSSCPFKRKEALARPLCPQHIGPWVLLCPAHSLPLSSFLPSPSTTSYASPALASCLRPVPTFTPSTLHFSLHLWSLHKAESLYPIQADPSLFSNHISLFSSNVNGNAWRA